MGFPKDLRSFLRDVEARAPHDVAYVDREVDSTLETAVLARRLGELGRFPVLFFRKVRGSRFPLVSNVHADRHKMALALETDAERLVELGGGQVPAAVLGSSRTSSICSRSSSSSACTRDW